MAQKTALKNAVMKGEIGELRERLAMYEMQDADTRQGGKQVASPDPVEVRAKEIYDQWPESKQWPWVVRGNSHKQEEARDLARKEITVPVKYEANYWHENGMLLGWVPLDVDSDDEADSRMNHGERGIWRRA